MMVMKVHKNLHFLKPRLLNVLLTFLVLCLPLLREQYNYGEYVTWHRPIVVIINYFQEPQQPHLLLIMAIFILAVYFVVSLAIVSVLKFIFPLFKSRGFK
jgi:hypothetical protein